MCNVYNYQILWIQNANAVNNSAVITTIRKSFNRGSYGFMNAAMPNDMPVYPDWL